jgi:hypothetical protein
MAHHSAAVNVNAPAHLCHAARSAREQSSRVRRVRFANSEPSITTRADTMNAKNRATPLSSENMNPIKDFRATSASSLLRPPVDRSLLR